MRSSESAPTGSPPLGALRYLAMGRGLWGSMVTAFLTCGFWSLLRFRGAVSEKIARTVDAQWISESLQDSAWWFTAAVLATALVLFASTRRV
jgi:hypothetical protein